MIRRGAVVVLYSTTKKSSVWRFVFTKERRIFRAVNDVAKEQVLKRFSDSSQARLISSVRSSFRVPRLIMGLACESLSSSCPMQEQNGVANFNQQSVPTNAPSDNKRTTRQSTHTTTSSCTQTVGYRFNGNSVQSLSGLYNSFNSTTFQNATDLFIFLTRELVCEKNVCDVWQQKCFREPAE